MKTLPRMNRRQLLKSLLKISTLVVVLPTQGVCRTPTKPGSRDPLLMHYRNKSSARLVGDEFIMAYPDEADIDNLVAELHATLGASPTQDHLHHAVEQQIRADFERRDTVNIRGWILSRTEARLCALVALNS